MTQTQVAVGIGLIIAIFFGSLVVVLQLKGNPDDPLYLTIVPYQSDAADASVPSTGMVPAARSGRVAMFAGFANQPAGAFVYSFLQEGGVRFHADWSTVRGNSVTVDTATTLPSWTNPGACVSPATECGHLALAVPSEGPPQIPDFFSINGAAEEAVAGNWTLQPGSLNLQSVDYHVIETTAADIPAGAQVTLRWLAWDGRGHPLLPPTP